MQNPVTKKREGARVELNKREGGRAQARKARAWARSKTEFSFGDSVLHEQHPRSSEENPRSSEDDARANQKKARNFFFWARTLAFFFPTFEVVVA